MIEKLIAALPALAAHLLARLLHLRQLIRGKRRAHLLKCPGHENLTLHVDLRHLGGALADAFLIQFVREHGILHLGAQLLLALAHLAHFLAIGLHRLAELLALFVVEDPLEGQSTLGRTEGSLAARAITLRAVLSWGTALLIFPGRLGDHDGGEAAHDKHSVKVEVMEWFHKVSVALEKTT